jgi:hypothetical protein
MKTKPGTNTVKFRASVTYSIFTGNVPACCAKPFIIPLRVCPVRWRVKRAPVEGMELAS